jgi:hypothetical protein
MRTLLAVPLLLVACARGAAESDETDARRFSDARTDARVTDAAQTEDAESTPDSATAVDARPIDGAVLVDGGTSTDAPTTLAVNLLLSEVVLAPGANEYIEIINPSDLTVSLAGYYLSDASDYFRTPSGLYNLGTSDFIVAFPTDFIGPRSVVTVALDSATAFQGIYSLAPTYSVADGTMLPVAANGVPTMTNGGEAIALFYWDGQSDLVTDVDLMIVGQPSSINLFADKSGLAVDGPDGDSATSVYATDARTMPAQASTPAPGFSSKRSSLEAGFEIQGGGGNGVNGDDETSEDTSQTWGGAFTAPTPGVTEISL